MQTKQQYLDEKRAGDNRRFKDNEKILEAAGHWSDEHGKGKMSDQQERRVKNALQENRDIIQKHSNQNKELKQWK